MKAGVIETVSQTDVAASAGSRSPNRLAADYAELVKARLTLLVLLTTAVGYYMGAGRPTDYAGLFHVVFGTASVEAGAAALNGAHKDATGSGWPYAADGSAHSRKRAFGFWSHLSCGGV